MFKLMDSATALISLARLPERTLQSRHSLQLAAVQKHVVSQAPSSAAQRLHELTYPMHLKLNRTHRLRPRLLPWHVRQQRQQRLGQRHQAGVQPRGGQRGKGGQGDGVAVGGSVHAVVVAAGPAQGAPGAAAGLLQLVQLRGGEVGRACCVSELKQNAKTA